MNKYNAVTTTIDGIKFASGAEAQRYCELKLLEKAGEIYDLEVHPRIQLQEALDEWTGVLKQLWYAIGKPVDSKQLAVYVKQLGDIPLGVLEDVVARIMREHTWHTVPTIGDIWAVVRKYYGDADRLRFWMPAPRGDQYAEVTQ